MGCATAIGAGRLRERMYPANIHQLRDQLSLEHQAKTVKEWKSLLSSLSLAERREALRLPEAIRDLGASRIANMNQAIDARHEYLIESVPTPNWLDQAYHHNAEFPPPGMVLGETKVRYQPDGLDSFESVGHQRFYPPQNVREEDGLDSGSDEFNVNIRSCSADVIQRWKYMNSPLDLS